MAERLFKRASLRLTLAGAQTLDQVEALKRAVMKSAKDADVFVRSFAEGQAALEVTGGQTSAHELARALEAAGYKVVEQRSDVLRLSIPSKK